MPQKQVFHIPSSLWHVPSVPVETACPVWPLVPSSGVAAIYSPVISVTFTRLYPWGAYKSGLLQILIVNNGFSFYPFSEYRKSHFLLSSGALCVRGCRQCPLHTPIQAAYFPSLHPKVRTLFLSRGLLRRWARIFFLLHTCWSSSQSFLGFLAGYMWISDTDYTCLINNTAILTGQCGLEKNVTLCTWHFI